MKKIRLGIIGLGNMGTGHLQNILDGNCPEFIVSAIADIKPERLEFAKTQVEGVATFLDADEMINSGLCDAILVAVPHYDHPRYAIASMKAGLHVMVEKPAGVYTKQVREMNEEAKKHNVIFGMMFNQRTNSIYKKMRELVQSGEYGQIRRTNWLITNWYRPKAYYDSGAWRASWRGEGGGVLLNQCPHQLDLMQWICGMPTRVQAHLSYGKWHEIEVEDDVTAYMEYENGATGVFITTTGDPCGSNRFEVQMDKAKIVVEDGELKVWELDMAEPEFSKTNTIPFASPNATKLELEIDKEDNPQHIGVMNAFAGAILRGEPLIANGEEGINGLTLSNAMHLSDWLGKAVDLPFDEDLYYKELMKRVATSKLNENASSVVADTRGSYNAK
ncbi:MAG: Gfo/Idh/MocA family oxidoreductase [Clostridia bacterium]|nr:Gfo/Idh/MocA family oxidoreductase [Clostridia bacterium]